MGKTSCLLLRLATERRGEETKRRKGRRTVKESHKVKAAIKPDRGESKKNRETAKPYIEYIDQARQAIFTLSL